MNELTTFEQYTLTLNAAGVVVAILIGIIAIWGERIRQAWNNPRLILTLIEPTFTSTQSGVKGWYYRLQVENSKPSCPASNVRIILVKAEKKGPDGNWREYKFSGPTQVMWQFPQLSPLYATVGPGEIATFGCLLENSKTFDLRLYSYPNNLFKTIGSNDPTRLVFIAVSDSAKSESIVVEIAWDGQWFEGRQEIDDHCVVKSIHELRFDYH